MERLLAAINAPHLASACYPQAQAPGCCFTYCVYFTYALCMPYLVCMYGMTWEVVMADAKVRADMVVPTEEDVEIATETSRTLAAMRGDIELDVLLGDGERLRLPKSMRSLISHILQEMSFGNAVTIMPVHAVLTTVEAADFLNVSRPHLISLLERGEIPFHKVGSHRRIRLADLQAYKQLIDERSEAAMRELAKQAQELGMGY